MQMKSPMIKLIIYCTAIVILAVFVNRVVVSINNKEIDNTDYYSLHHFTSKCYPDAKADIKKALDNDGEILMSEYYDIIRKCSDLREIDKRDSKHFLKEFVE